MQVAVSFSQFCNSLISWKYKQNWMKIHDFLTHSFDAEIWVYSPFHHTYRNGPTSSNQIFSSFNILLSTVTDNRFLGKSIETKKDMERLSSFSQP